jgi:uncharacterized membrane protein YcaP (DUF421 family)
VQLFDWHALIVNLFHLGVSDSAVSIVEKVIRPVAIYVLLVVALHLFGRRMLAQLNPFDFVVLLMLSNTVQNAIIGNDTSLSGGIIGAGALLAANALAVRFYYRGPNIEHQLMEERDVYLIRDHRPQLEELRKLSINMGELTAKAHERGFDDVHEVETAVLYPNGTIYMKGGPQGDSARLAETMHQIQELRKEVALLRR